MLEVIHNRTALRLSSGVHRLHELLRPDQLESGCARIEQARIAGPALLITLQSGVTHRVPSPVDNTEPQTGGGVLVRNIGQLLTMAGSGIGLVEEAEIRIHNGRVLSAGKASPTTDFKPETTIDAQGGLVTPGLVDPHTHPVFAGSRHVEFGLKAEGASYLEIHKAGGGIYATVEATRQASQHQLAETCRNNLNKLLSWGVTTCEAKSGYALQTEGELKMLRALREAGNAHPLDVVPTFLGAHAVPVEYHDNRDDYVALIVEEMIPRVAAENLADYCDAYCEDGAFSRDEVTRIFDAAKAHGLALRLHAEQFTDQDGARLAAEMGAHSADHLEAISPAGIDAMAAHGTVAILLPGAALMCRAPWPPAATLREAGVPIALGTDLNPGSSYTAALPLMMSLACSQMGLSCEAAWRAVTVEAARSLGRPNVGRLTPGAQADLAIFRAPDYRFVPYHFGQNLIQTVLKSGHVVHQS